MNRQQFASFCKEKITNHPDLEVNIIDYYRLALDEISDGGSESHEIELAVNDIEDLIKNSDYKTFNESPYSNN
jgi:hypothetical protein